ncbi:hypothetical protein VP01_228g5 [Puccinia sorghi]|uniref:Uncharacterized protein n=1 Tax=Puccinia sorghi TaxID=27349 RepID=A0A0L6V8R2_9BASI|nr:hypothetical protein VP01_228g5 [Puccinia sorghi]
MMEETDREEEDQDNQIKTFFSPHISRYGEVLLNVQHIHHSLISENYLSVYIKILEYVSSQLITAHPVVTKRLVRFYPLILQAVRLLNNALNPYNSNSSEPAEGSNQMRSLLENLGPEEIHQLISIVQPFIHLQFGSMGYLDAHSDSEEDDVSEKYTEEVIEMEEMDGGDEDASIDVEDPADDEEIHITKGIQLDQDLKQSCLQPPPPTSDNQFPSPACPPLWTTLTKPDRPTKLSMKETLQLEVEELLSILSF